MRTSGWVVDVIGALWVSGSTLAHHGTRPANDVPRGLAVVRGPTDPAGHVEAE
jgi:hypothetical protein